MKYKKYFRKKNTNNNNNFIKHYYILKNVGSLKFKNLHDTQFRKKNYYNKNGNV